MSIYTEDATVEMVLRRAVAGDLDIGLAPAALRAFPCAVAALTAADCTTANEEGQVATKEEEKMAVAWTWTGPRKTRAWVAQAVRAVVAKNGGRAKKAKKKGGKDGASGDDRANGRSIRGSGAAAGAFDEGADILSQKRPVQWRI